MSEQHTFVRPTTQITSHADLEIFLKSPTCAGWVNFLQGLNASVANKKLSDESVTSPVRTHFYFFIWTKNNLFSKHY